MKLRKRTAIIGATIVAATLAITGCSNDAVVVDQNLTKDAENFKVDRRVVFFNGITDEYLLSVEGKCNIENEGDQLATICKIGDDGYKKHFLGLSDNVTYFVEQLEPRDVSEYHYKVIFKPEQIIPDIDVNTSGGN